MNKYIGTIVGTLAISSMAIAEDTADDQSEAGLTSGQVIIEPEIKEYNDWNHICIKDDAGTNVCQVQHVISNEDGGRVATIEVFKVPINTGFTAGAAVALPLGISLSDGLEFRIEGAPPRRFDFSICVTDGCLSRIGLSELTIQRMIEGATTTISVNVGLASEQQVELDISLNGFAEAFELLTDEVSSIEDQSEVEIAQGEVITEPEIEIFDDWASACLIGETGEKECAIRQVLFNDDGVPLAKIDVFKVDDGELFIAGAEILVPHGVTIENGLEIQVDKSLPRRYEFSTCLRDGCLARVGITESEMEKMRTGQNLNFVFYVGLGGVSEQLIEFSASLKGFTEAFNTL